MAAAAEAVRVTRMPMLVTDATLPGNPITFANQAFMDLSGYTIDYGVSTETIRKWRKRARRLPGPLQPSAQVALEGNRRGARHCVRPAPCNRLPAG